MTKVFFYLFILLTGLSAYAQNSNLEKVNRLIDSLSENNQIMGNLAIYQGEQKVSSKTFGYNNVLIRSKGNTESLYRIGAVSETFIATVIFQLIDENKINLDSKLSNFYPDFKKSSEITIENLLNHSSGLSNLEEENEQSFEKLSIENSSLFEDYKKQDLKFIPGTKNEYANIDYLLLAKIVEKIEKKPFNRVLSNRFEKIINTRRLERSKKINSKNNEALGYKYQSKQWVYSSENDKEIPITKGQISTTATNLVQFYMALFSNELLKDSSLLTMKSEAIGLERIQFHDKTAYQKSGEIDGFESVVIYFPKDQTGVALCLNATRLNAEKLVLDILNIYFGY